MEHFIFSDSLVLENANKLVRVVPGNIDFIKELKDDQGSDIYLCGGGVFAGWLLEHQLIDKLKIKLNPFIAGHGTPMFVHKSDPVNHQLELVNSHSYDHGLQIMEYHIQYENKK
ncbi:MAG: dihydrofolate reductase family protein [Cyclobacteriaceae bacterium]